MRAAKSAAGAPAEGPPRGSEQQPQRQPDAAEDEDDSAIETDPTGMFWAKYESTWT
jgi:hypothetical protein